MKQEPINKIIEFRDSRDWKQYHSGKDLSISISLEASELLEIFQWSKEEVDKLDKIDKEIITVIAKVLKDNNKEYYSYVFATFNKGWFKEVLVFNNEDNVFELLNIYNTIPSIKRKVFIIDTDIKKK